MHTAGLVFAFPFLTFRCIIPCWLYRFVSVQKTITIYFFCSGLLFIYFCSIRDRPQWNDHDRRDRDERRERSEKSVNDRLWEMAEGYSSRDRPRELDMPDPTPIPPLLEKPDFPPLLDKPDFPPLLDKPDFPPLLDKPEFPPIEDPRDLIEQRGFDDRFRRDFDPRMRHMHDDFPPMQEPMSEFNRRLHHDEFEHERFGRRDRQDDFIDQRIMRDEFEGKSFLSKSVQ